MKTITILLTVLLSSCADTQMREAARTGGFEYDGDFYSCRLVERMTMQEWLAR